MGTAHPLRKPSHSPFFCPHVNTPSAASQRRLTNELLSHGPLLVKGFWSRSPQNGRRAGFRVFCACLRISRLVNVDVAAGYPKLSKNVRQSPRDELVSRVWRATTFEHHHCNMAHMCGYRRLRDSNLFDALLASQVSDIVDHSAQSVELVDGAPNGRGGVTTVSQQRPDLDRCSGRVSQGSPAGPCQRVVIGYYGCLARTRNGCSSNLCRKTGAMVRYNGLTTVAAQRPATGG